MKGIRAGSEFEVRGLRAVVVLLASAMMVVSAMAFLSPGGHTTARAAPMTFSISLNIDPAYEVSYWKNASRIQIDGFLDYEDVPEGEVEINSFVGGLSSSASPATEQIQGSGSYPVMVIIYVHGIREDVVKPIRVEGTYVYWALGVEYRVDIQPFEGVVNIVVYDKPHVIANGTKEKVEGGVSFDPFGAGMFIVYVLLVTLPCVVLFGWLLVRRRRNEEYSR